MSVLPSGCITLYYYMPDDQLFLQSHRVPRRKCSRCWSVSSVSVRTSNRTWQPRNHCNKCVTRSYQRCDSLTLRDMTMTIIISIIIIIHEIYIITNSVFLVLFYSDPFWWKLVLKKSCRHVAKFRHSYANSTWFHSWSLINLSTQNYHVIHLMRPAI
jgi:hypothetical protein